MATDSNIKRVNVLGVGVDLLNREETVEKISKVIENSKNKKLFHIVTAYSEFFVTAKKDLGFKKVLMNADLVLPDGVGPLAAVNYRQSVKTGDGFLTKMVKGGITGVNVLSGNVGETVSGVWLFSELIKKSAKNGWKVFLLGGFGEVSYRLEKQLLYNYPNLKIKSDPGPQNLDIKSDESVAKVNAFAPDILFVAFGPGKQEKWIDLHKKELGAKVAIGVGGTFDELTGKVSSPPAIIERAGLKWLWRLKEEPRRFNRILNAFPIFPFMVFWESIKK